MWQREAKPLAGFDVRERPVGGLVHKILAERVAAYDQEDRASSKAKVRQARRDYVAAKAAGTLPKPKPMAEIPDVGGDPMPSKPAEITEDDIADTMAKVIADVLPTLPETITIHIRPGRLAEIEDATKVADYKAARSPIAITARTLRRYEAELREKVKRHAAFVGVDEEAVRLLDIAAHLREAVSLIDTHATPDQDNG